MYFNQRNELVKNIKKGDNLLYSKKDFSKALKLLIFLIKEYFATEKVES